MLGAIAGARAQDDVARRAADRLADHAEQCAKAGAIDAARRAWLEVLFVYERDSERARRYLVDTRERVAELGADGGERGALRADASWTRARRDLAELHRDAARREARAGPGEAATAHWRRVLRFAPADEEAGRALGLEPFDGAWLEPHRAETLIGDRARDQVLVLLAETTWPVEPVREGPVAEILAQAPRVRRLTGVRGPSTEVWTDKGREANTAVLLHVERAVLLTRALLASARDRDALARGSIPMYVGVERRADYQALCELGDQSGEQRAFARDRAIATWLRREPRRIYLANATGAVLLDWAVRCTAVRVASPEPFALLEGTGHAACQWLLGRSLNHFAGTPPQRGERTLSDALTADVTLPDQRVWQRLAIEQAWLGNGPDLANLLGLDADNMPVSARLDAWALQRYLLARDPALAHRLGAAGVAGAGRAGAVRDAFVEPDGLGLDELHEQVRAHWRYDETGLVRWREASHADGPAETRVFEALRAIAKARATALRPPFGAVRGLPAPVRRAVQTPRVRAVLAGELDARELSGDERAQFEDVAAGAIDVATATLRDLDGEVFHGIPALRDLVLAAEVGTVRFAVDGSRTLLWIPPLPPDASAPAVVSPADGAERVPTGVAALELGAAAVQQLGVAPGTSRVGWPITLHVGLVPRDGEVSCDVTTDRGPIAGVVVRPSRDLACRLAPPSVVVFVPVAPLPAATQVEVSWRWSDGGVAHTAGARFRTR